MSQQRDSCQDSAWNIRNTPSTQAILSGGPRGGLCGSTFACLDTPEEASCALGGRIHRKVKGGGRGPIRSHEVVGRRHMFETAGDPAKCAIQFNVT